MRYLGSKAGTLRQLSNLVADLGIQGTFCDPFGGVGIVGSHFRSAGYEVHSGDILEVAHRFQVARLMVKAPPLPEVTSKHLAIDTAEEFREYLDSLPRVRSWLAREFSEKRLYFSSENAQRIDGIRRALWSLRANRYLPEPAFSYYLASLIDSMDRVANTAGTYYAHLKALDRKAQRPFTFQLLPTRGEGLGTAYLMRAENLVSLRTWDILYLDPPYNRRDYAAYYHLPETIASGRRPRPRGVSGVDAAARPNSGFRNSAAARQSFDELLARASFRALLLHYSDDGLLHPDYLREALAAKGSLTEAIVSTEGYSTRGARKTAHRVYVVIR